MVQVYIIAGGPGDPELLTMKGHRIIKKADIIFASRRFFSEAMFDCKKDSCQFYESFETTYEEKMVIIRNGVAQDLIIAYICAGDPCLYGMIQGLADRLERENINYEVIPGVSSFNAACAIVKKQMTGLGITNTAICTTSRDTPQTEEHLNNIAKLQASVALFMSLEKIDTICSIFSKHYSPDTPAAVISNASRPEQKVLEARLADMGQKVREEGIEDGLILIGAFLDTPYDYELERQFMERKRREADSRVPK